MLYVEIDGNTYSCEYQDGRTQSGKKAVRIISENAPVATNGLKLFEGNNQIADFSDYKNLYREEGTVKEYTKEAEEIVPVECLSMGDVPSSSIQRQINSLNSRVNAITPYVESKTVGIQDSECVFTGIRKDGTLTAYVKTDKGEYLPCTVERADSRVRISFDKLDTVATVTISIQ